jgi:hypothetical protein
MRELFEYPAQVPAWTDAIAGGPVDWPAMLAGYDALVDAALVGRHATTPGTAVQ